MGPNVHINNVQCIMYNGPHPPLILQPKNVGLRLTGSHVRTLVKYSVNKSL